MFPEMTLHLCDARRLFSTRDTFASETDFWMVGAMCKIPEDDQKCLLDASQEIMSRVLVEEANEFEIVSITSDGAHVIDFQGDWHWYLLVIGGAGAEAQQEFDLKRVQPSHTRLRRACERMSGNSGAHSLVPRDQQPSHT
jgi:hypothetical protein